MCLIMRWLTSLAVISALAGCANDGFLKPSASPKRSWQHYYRQLKQITQWRISGVVGIKAGSGVSNANFSWHQHGSNYALAFYGPFGLDSHSLTGNGATAELKTSDGKRYYAPTPQALMQQFLGWSVPLSGLIFWIRGIPDPSAVADYQLNQYGLLSSLKQQGWVINYQAYQMTTDGPWPKRLQLTAKNLTVTVVINAVH